MTAKSSNPVTNNGSKPGERRGGRQKGVPNKATIARQKDVEDSGSTPLEVMLKAYRHFEKQADAAMTKAKRARGDTRAALLKQADSLLRIAAEEARGAAPYIHPRLATMQTQVNLTGRLSLEQHLAQPIAQPANSNTPKGTSLDTPISNTGGDG